MTHHVSPPVDQRIVDDYFKLCKSKKNNKLAWFYGMLATFGVKPDQLKQFKWNEDGTINIPSRKRPVRPMHPQWVFLFSLKEKQPSNVEDCWNNAWLLIYQAMACKEIEHNDDLSSAATRFSNESTNSLRNSFAAHKSHRQKLSNFRYF